MVCDREPEIGGIVFEIGQWLLCELPDVLVDILSFFVIALS
jgi:hypothetical protein